MSRHRIHPVSVSALVAALAGSRASGDGTVVLTGVTQDSRDVEPGDLFCCVVGERHDGHLLAREAVAAGAVALLAERDLHGVDVPVISVRSVRAALGPVAVELFGSPARGMRTVGVTGTNGKTSTTAMLGAILARSARRPRRAGTAAAGTP